MFEIGPLVVEKGKYMGMMEVGPLVLGSEEEPLELEVMMGTNG